MNYSDMYTVTEFNSPLGQITLVATKQGVSQLLFEPSDATILEFKNKSIPYKLIDVKQNPAALQLIEYFEGRRKSFTIPLDINTTAFREKVWKTLLTIPYGKTMSYGQIAQMIGNPKASRAVGGACGANPIPIVIPCHRVLTSDGRLGGYTGGTHIKKALLNLEGIVLRDGSI